MERGRWKSEIWTENKIQRCAEGPWEGSGVGKGWRSRGTGRNRREMGGGAEVERGG